MAGSSKRKLFVPNRLAVRDAGDLPNRCRPLQIIHGFDQWPETSDDALRKRLRKMKEAGLGGIVANVSFKNYLLDDAAWALLRRGVQIAREWADGWPSGAGVVSSFQKALHPQHGALWGVYYTMAENPARQITLLADLGATLDEWRRLTANWTPALPAQGGR